MKINLLLVFWLFSFLSCSSLATGSASRSKSLREMISHPDDADKKIELFWSKPQGEGQWPLIFFIHGHQDSKKLGGKDFVDWGVLEKWNKNGFVAAAISQPGYGQSDGPADFCGPYTQNATKEALKFLTSKS